MARRLFGYLVLGHRLRMVAVIFLMVLTAAVELLNPWPLKVVVDNVIGQQPLSGYVLSGSVRGIALILAALSYVVLAGIGGSFSVLYERWLTEISQKVGLALASDLYAQVQRLSLRFHDRARVGDMVTRITGDVEKLQESIASGVSLLSIDMVTLFGIAGIMFLMDWQFALVAFLIVPFLLLSYSVFKERVKRASQVVRSSESAMASVAHETLSSIRVVKAFGQEDRERERFLDQTRSKVEASVQAITWQGIFAFVVDFITAVGVAIILAYGGWRVIRGSLSLGQMLVFIQYLRSLYGPLRGFGRLTSLVQVASASAERIEELFRAAPEVPESPRARSLGKAYGWILFDAVWFGYEPASPVLRSINLEIQPGEVMAIVGPTGAGKSTLASLIPRFYDVSQGRVLIDGTDVRDLGVRSLRQQISIVLQDSFLFSGSIRDNIAYGRPGASDQEILAVAQAAHAHEFIVNLPDGYGAPVGERGVTLSGGQRQRIAIARALLKDAPILILDEPTSAVDTESEALIMEALGRLMKERTVIVITHRVSITALADRVAVIVDGVITETGRRGELAPEGHLHRRLQASPLAGHQRDHGDG